MLTNTSHLAYSDESHYNVGQYRAIGMISMRAELAEELNRKIQILNQESDVKECKWYKLESAKNRFAIQKIIDLCLEYADIDRLRIDVLVWDSEDSRHKVIGRDENKNLMNLYIQLLKNVILRRWKGNGVWQLFPDQNSIIDWVHVRNILRKIDIYNDDSESILDRTWNRFKSLHSIVSIEEADSKITGLCQAIDIFTGMSVFSFEKTKAYLEWCRKTSNQPPLFSLENIKLSNKDIEQSSMLNYFLEQAATKNIRFHFENNSGLVTKDPNQVVNVWFYTPQTLSDKAPIRDNF